MKQFRCDTKALLKETIIHDGGRGSSSSALAAVRLRELLRGIDSHILDGIHNSV